MPLNQLAIQHKQGIITLYRKTNQFISYKFVLVWLLYLASNTCTIMPSHFTALLLNYLYQGNNKQQMSNKFKDSKQPPHLATHMQLHAKSEEFNRYLQLYCCHLILFAWISQVIAFTFFGPQWYLCSICCISLKATIIVNLTHAVDIF